MLWLTSRKLKAKDPWVRVAAVQEIANSRHKDAPGLLVPLLKDDDVNVRGSVARVLGGLGDQRAIEPLAAALEAAQTSGDTLPICRALGNLGGVRAAEALVAKMARVEWTQQEEIYHNLLRIGRPAAPALAALLKRTQEETVQRRAIKLLKAAGDPSAIDGLRTALKASTFQTRRLAAEALAFFGQRPEGPDEEALFAVACGNWEQAASLGAVAVGPLMAVMDQPESNAGETMSAEKALFRIRDPRALDSLLEWLKGPNLPSLGAAIEALGFFGDPQAIKPLLKVFRMPPLRSSAEQRDIDAISVHARHSVQQILRAADVEGWGRIAKRDEPAEVIEALQEATRATPDSAEAWHELGLALTRKDEWKMGRDAVEKAAKLDPGNVEAWISVGLINCRYSDFESAIEAFRAAIERDAHCRKAWFNLTMAYYQSENIGAAHGTLEKLKRTDPVIAEYLHQFIP